MATKRLALALVLVAAIPFLGGTLARAGTTITVSTSADVVANDGSCSLREAIEAANTDTASGPAAGECPAGSSGSPDVVSVPPGTYSLTGCQLAPSTAMTVAGTGPTATILDGMGACSVLSTSAAVTLSGLTIRNGSAATGAGISNAGNLTLRSSTITGNSASGQGGGIANSGILTVTNSTITGNTATNQGGGLYNSGTTTLSFTTVSGNGSGSGGGAFAAVGSTTTLEGTVLAKSTSGGDCAGSSLTSNGHNLVQGPGTCFTGGPTDVTGKDPKLGALADNGGPTQTLRPATGSPVLDAAEAACATTDQRGLPRPQGQACDIGSVEPDCTMTGTSGKDLIEGGAGVDIICGLGGNDRLKGNAGNDVLIGGDGDDALHAAEGDDKLVGGDGNDHLRPGSGSNVLDGGNGNDTIEYGNLTGGVTVNLVAGTATGGGADDTLTSMECVDGTDFGDTLIGTAGPNTFTGKGGNDTLNGDAGNDTLDGAAGDDTLNGGADADNLLPGTGAANVVHGEAGTDMLSYAPVTGAGVSVNLGAGTATGVITLDGIENVTGTNLDDVLIGNGSNNGLTGLAGADTLRGLSGSDPLNGGDGNDTLEGGDSNDSLRPGPGANSVDGGNGVDTVDYSGLTSGGVSVNLGAGATTGAANDSLLNVENATGTKQADSLFGSTLANVLSGLSGADTLDSSGDLAKDTVNGGVDGDTDVCTADATDKVVNCP